MKKIVLASFFLFNLATSLNGENRFIWEDLTVNLPEGVLRDFVVTPEQLFVLGKNSLWKSNDRGKSWKQILNVSSNQFVVKETLKKNENSLLFRFVKESDQDKVEFNKDLFTETEARIFSENEFIGGTVLEQHPTDKDFLLAGTFNGLYVSYNSGEEWKKIQFGIGRESQVILSIHFSLADPERIYIGTLKGLYFTKNRGQNWRQLKRGFRNEPVAALFEDKENRLWVSVLNKGIYSTQDFGRRWEKYTLGIGERDNLIEDFALFQNSLLAINRSQLHCFNKQKGEWRECFQGSPLGSGLKHVAVLPESNSILISGKEGLFFSEGLNSSFKQIALGVRFQNSSRIRSLNQQIYFLSPRGLFAGEKGENKTLSLDQSEELIWKKFSYEPTIQEVHQQAMLFAKTHPALIKKWERGAKWRSLLPKLQLGFDEQRVRQHDLDSGLSQDYSYSEEFSTDQSVITASTFKGNRIIPTQSFSQEETYDEDADFENSRFRERETEFVMSAVWELGDFLYNPEQVDISKEARAIAELRDDILKEVTQFYFRRRHLQFDLILEKQDMNDPQDDKDKKKKNAERLFRMHLELQELTAQLDALTGGWFSKEIEKRRKFLVNS